MITSLTSTNSSHANFIGSDCDVCYEKLEENQNVLHHGNDNLSLVHPIHEQCPGYPARWEGNSCPTCRTPYNSVLLQGISINTANRFLANAAELPQRTGSTNLRDALNSIRNGNTVDQARIDFTINHYLDVVILNSVAAENGG